MWRLTLVAWRAKRREPGVRARYGRGPLVAAALLPWSLITVARGTLTRSALTDKDRWAVLVFRRAGQREPLRLVFGWLLVGAMLVLAAERWPLETTIAGGLCALVAFTDLLRGPRRAVAARRQWAEHRARRWATPGKFWIIVTIAAEEPRGMIEADDPDSDVDEGPDAQARARRLLHSAQASWARRARPRRLLTAVQEGSLLEQVIAGRAFEQVDGRGAVIEPCGIRTTLMQWTPRPQVPVTPMRPAHAPASVETGAGHLRPTPLVQAHGGTVSPLRRLRARRAAAAAPGASTGGTVPTTAAATEGGGRRLRLVTARVETAALDVVPPGGAATGIGGSDGFAAANAFAAPGGAEDMNRALAPSAYRVGSGFAAAGGPEGTDAAMTGRGAPGTHIAGGEYSPSGSSASRRLRLVEEGASGEATPAEGPESGKGSGTESPIPHAHAAASDHRILRGRRSRPWWRQRDPGVVRLVRAADLLALGQVILIASQLHLWALLGIIPMALIALGWSRLEARRVPVQVTAWQWGSEGEGATEALLGPLEDLGCMILHDRTAPQTSTLIDHLVVAPSGVWVIETKSFLEAVQMHGANLLAGVWSLHDDLVATRAQGVEVRNALDEVATRVEGPPMTWIHPAMAIHGRTKRLGRTGREVSGVHVIAAHFLPELIATQPERLSRDLITSAAELLEHRFPPANERRQEEEHEQDQAADG